MKDLGRLQKVVLEKIKAASDSADGAVLGILGPIMGQMDEMHDRWLAMLGTPPTGVPNSPSPSNSPPLNGASGRALAPVDVTGHRIRDAKFAGERLSVSSYKDLLLTLIGRLQKLHPNDFDSKAPQVSGRYPYFSSDPKKLRSPKKIDDMLFVETNLNSRLIVDICRRLVTTMGHTADELELDVEPFRTRSRGEIEV